MNRMPETIDITDVRLTEMAAEQMTPVMAQSGVSWYQLTLVVQNRSDEPVHVVTDIRRIRYEADRRLLVVQLAGPEVSTGSPVVGVPMPPRYRELGARERATIVHPLSSPITFLEMTADGTRHPRDVRLAEDVDSIECTLGYETEPPAPVTDLTAWRTPEPRRGRGNTVTASWQSLRRGKPNQTSQ